MILVTDACGFVGRHLASALYARSPTAAMRLDNLSFREIADVICRVAGVRKRVITVPDGARALLGFVASVRMRSSGGAQDLSLTRRYAYQNHSSQKARDELAYLPRGFDQIVSDVFNH